MRPVCFVTMPFGVKTDPVTGETINFDRVYDEMIVPGIALADMEAIRLDVIGASGVIHRASYESMVFSDFVVADISTANPNVMYDLGVRHSFHPRGTILICRSGTRLPFDLSLLFVLLYQFEKDGMPDRSFSHRLADQLRAAQSDAVTSPVYQLLSGVQPPLLDRSKSDLFRSQTAYETSLLTRINFAAESGLPELRVVEDEIRKGGELSQAIVSSLFASYRSLGGWEDMLRISASMSVDLTHSVGLQEQLAEALNSLDRPDEAAQKIKPLLRNEADSGVLRVWGDIQRKRWLDSSARGETLRPRTYIHEAITAYTNAFKIDPRMVSPGVRAVLLTEVSNRSAASTSLTAAVDYSVRVRVTLPVATCLDCISAVVLAAVVDNEALANEALDRLPLTPTDLPAVRGALEDLDILRSSRASSGGNVPKFVSDVENCLAEAQRTKPGPLARQTKDDSGDRPAVHVNTGIGANVVDNKKDFFISYTKADRDWATWIAWTLEEANYTVVIQEWDFKPGSDFVQNMDKALKETSRTILVLSEDFLKSTYTAAEWSAAFTKDPSGKSGLMVPVRVRECKPEGLLSSKVYVDLVGLSEDDAKAVLLGAFSGRTRPALPPSFPGKRVAPEPATFPGEQVRGSRSEVINAQIKRAEQNELAVQPKPTSLSPLERLNLIKLLNQIPSELFNMIVYAVNPPPGIVPPAPASQGQRSAALLMWAEGPAGRGISEIQETLKDLLKG